MEFDLCLFLCVPLARFHSSCPDCAVGAAEEPWSEGQVTNPGSDPMLFVQS